MMGRLSPLENIGPKDIRVRELIARLDKGGVREVILATNPTVDGDATASYLEKALRNKKVRVTRPARGIPAGSAIEHVDSGILGEAIRARRTVRSFRDTPLTGGQLDQILWAAQGITHPRGRLRAAPSAGALYPMEVDAVVGEGGVSDVAAGCHRFDPRSGKTVARIPGDLRQALARASLGQMWMARAPVNLVISAVYARTTGKYGPRGVRYADIEAGCVAENVFLMAVSLGLAAGIVGAFDDGKVARLLSLAGGEEPLLVMPVGFSSKV